jgi:hypothetical protein
VKRRKLRMRQAQMRARQKVRFVISDISEETLRLALYGGA